MSILDRLFRKRDEPIVPIGYHREGTDQIIVESEYVARWIKQYSGDKILAVNKILVHLKEQYPEVTQFQIRK